MRYVIVSVVKGKAGNFNNNLRKEVFQKFNAKSSKLPAHFTIKAPFEYDDIEELEDYCKENDIAMPKYVWGTTVSKISMDADSIIESACEELYEEAGEQIDDRDSKELQDMLDKWCEKQRGTDTYYVDYNVAILIGGN